MSRAIMISVQPKWCEKILNREKGIEIRKTMPKCEFPIDVYIYCTKGKEHLVQVAEYPSGAISYQIENNKPDIMMNGKVVAKFTLNKFDEVIMPVDFTEENPRELSIITRSCLTGQELLNYLGSNVFKSFYAWHIDNLEIFDKPKELREFLVNAKRDEHWVGHKYLRLNKVPQSWCYCEVEQ